MPILDFALVRNCSRLAARCHRGYRNWMEETSFKGLIATMNRLRWVVKLFRETRFDEMVKDYVILVEEESAGAQQPTRTAINRTEPVKPVIRRGVGIVLTLDYLRKGTTAARLETSREHQQGEP